MSAGYYLMHRGWLDHAAFGSRKREPFCRAAAWAWLIEQAAYQVCQVRIEHQVIELKRGQLCHSLRFLGTAWGWGHEKVRRFLGELVEHGMVTKTLCQLPPKNATRTETSHETAQSIITICNYDRYQGSSEAARQPTRQDARQRRDNGETKTNQGNQGKEKNLKNLKRGELGRFAPSAVPDPAPEPEPEPSASVAPVEVREAPDEPEELTQEEREERIAILNAVLQGLNDKGPAGGVRNPEAHQRAVHDHKREAWLRGLHEWASERLGGDDRMQAWEAISCAMAAGSRDATPQPVRRYLDRLDQVQRAESGQMQGVA